MFEDPPEYDIIIELISILLIYLLSILLPIYLYIQMLINKKENNHIISRYINYWLYTVSRLWLGDYEAFEEAIDEVERLNSSSNDDYLDISSLTIRELRQEDDLSLAYRLMRHIPLYLACSQGSETIKKVDLTECGIRDLTNLKHFTSLETLVLDKNGLENLSTCPNLPNLLTLWCNNNNISNLKKLLVEIKEKFPLLNYLSIMCNPCVPSIIDSDMDSSILSQLDSKLAQKIDSTLDNEVDSKLDSKLDNKIDSNIDSPIVSQIDNKLDSKVEIKLSYTQKEYRYVVIYFLPQLRVLDWVDVTLEEFTAAQKFGQAISDRIHDQEYDDKDEDDVWKWPDGYEVPMELLRDKEKMAIIRQVQTQLAALEPNYRELGKQTYWDINKRTITRYCEANLWKENPKGPTFAASILETIHWRLKYPIPCRDIDALTKGLSYGSAFVYGYSKNGNPIIYLTFPKIIKNKPIDHSLNILSILYTFERAIYLCMPIQLQEFNIIIDTTHLSFNHVPPMNLLQQLIDSLSKHFKRRIGIIFVLGVSWLVNRTYDMISYAISDVTKKKIKFLSNKNAGYIDVLQEYIDIEFIFEKLGGNAKDLQFINISDYLQQDVYLHENNISARRIYS